MDMRKLLNTLTETTAGATAAGSVASVAQPMETQFRVKVDNPDKPEVIEYGNWENSALTTAEGVKSVRKKSAKVVKSIYGEDAPVTNKKTRVAESTKDLHTELAAFIQQQKDKKATATKGSQSAPRKSSDPNSPPWLQSGEKIISDYYTNLRRRPDVDGDDHPYYEDKTHGLMEEDNHWKIVKIDKRADGSYAVHLKDTRDDQVKVKVGSKKYLEGLLKKQYGITKELSEGISEDTLDESDLIINPAGMAKLSRGLVSKDHDRTDHEVEMARSDLYQTSKNALQIFKLIQGLSEEEGLEGWVQEKIIKAADYLTTVREYLEGKHLAQEEFTNLAMSALDESPDGVSPSTKMFTSEDIKKKEDRIGDDYSRLSDDDIRAEIEALKKHEGGRGGGHSLATNIIKDLEDELAKRQELGEGKGKKPGLWANIRAKRERIKAGSGERMRKPGSKGAPSDKDLKSIRAASATEGVAEGKDSGYREIEFICVNPKFPNATDPELQKQMFQQLKNIPGVIPLFQGWDDYSQGQMSLSAIYKDRAVRGQILGLAKRLGVKVDLEQSVSDEYVDRAIRGEHEGQQGVAEGLDEAVGGNYLYHATGSDIDVLKNIISNGLRTNSDNQERTGSKLKALSFTRNWRYALTKKDDDNQETRGIANGVIFVVDQDILKQKNKMQSVDRPADAQNALKSILNTLSKTNRINDLYSLADSVGDLTSDQLAVLSKIAGQNVYGSRSFIVAVTKPYFADKTNQQALANAQSKIKQALSYFIKTSAGKSIASAGGSTGSEYEEVILTPLDYVPFKNLGVVGYMINPEVDSAKQQEIRNLFAKVGVKEVPIPNSTRPRKSVAEGRRG